MRTTKQVNSSKLKKAQVNSRKFRKILSYSHLLEASLFVRFSKSYLGNKYSFNVAGIIKEHLVYNFIGIHVHKSVR